MHLTWKRKLLLLVTCSIALLAAVTVYLSPQDQLQDVDAIVAISGGNTEARVLEAVSLYKSGRAPILIFSGAALDPLSPSNAEVMRAIALREGVAETDIRIEEQAQNTEENASKTKFLVDQFDYESIILVTSGYHQRRAYLEFRNRFGSDFTIINNPADDKEWSRTTWFTSPRGWRLTIAEAVKTPITLVRTVL